MKKNIIITSIKLLLLVSVLTVSQNIYAAETTVTNNVSVEASKGTSQASIKTTVNGTVIEDSTYVSEDEPITITNTYTSDNTVTQAHILTEDEEIAALRTRLAQLLALLQYYVSLLEQ